MKLSKLQLFEHVDYTPHLYQMAVHFCDRPRRVLACGARWGKSTCATMEIVAEMLKPRSESLVWCVGPTFETAEIIFGGVVRTMLERFPHRVLDHKPREHRLVVMNLAGGRSELRSKSCEDANSLVGAALDFVVIDEAARVSPRIWQNCISQRLVDRKGSALLISTPRGADSWFYREWRLGKRNRDPRYISMASPSWANPHVDREWIEQERTTLSKDAFDQEYGAVFLGADLEPCDRCGGPALKAPCSVMLYGNQKLPECPDCGLPIGPDGKTRSGIVNGKPYTLITRVISNYVAVPEVITEPNEAQGARSPALPSEQPTS